MKVIIKKLSENRYSFKVMRPTGLDKGECCLCGISRFFDNPAYEVIGGILK